MDLKIIFVGICLLVGVQDAPRTVVLPDLASGEEVHGHHIQPHDALIRIAGNMVVLDKTDWPHTVDPNGVLLFRLDHRELTLSGTADAPALEITSRYHCLVPRIGEQCPEHDSLRPLADLLSRAAAWLELDRGKLDAFREEGGAVSSVYSRATTGDVTISGKSAQNVRTIVVKGNAEVLIVNGPREEEIVPNHFLAYYDLMLPGSCCTNIPFPFRKSGCDPQDHGTVPAVMSTLGRRVATVACSNSNYP